MNNLTKNLLKISAGFGICILGSFTNSNSQVKANTCATNPNSISSACYITPSTYKIKVYEMGLCTSDPLGGTVLNTETDEVETDNTIDESSCSPTFKSSNGSVVDLAGGNTQTLTGTNIRPLAGEYPSAYIKIDNTFGLKGSYQINDITYYSIANGGKDQDSSNNVEWDEDLKDFDNGNSCNTDQAQRIVAGLETFTSGVTGTMKALLAKDNNGTYTGVTQATCDTSDRLYGVFAPTTPVTITDETQGLEVTFSITNRGMTIIPDGSGGMFRFSSGPFSPSFVTY